MLVDEGWLRSGCIVFSQYFDSARWLAGRLSGDLPDEAIVTHNVRDFSGAEAFGIPVVTPAAFLRLLEKEES